MHMTMGAGMCGTHMQGEPDITTAGQEAWRAWFSALPDADKLAWASAYKGEPVEFKAAALSIARDYATTAGFTPSDVFSPYSYHEMAARQSEQDRNAMLLAGVAIAGIAFLILRPRRRRR